MAVRFSEEQERFHRDLSERFEEHVAAYRSDRAGHLAADGREALEEELAKHERYLEGCRRSEIDDTELGIRFVWAKTRVLRELLEAPPSSPDARS